LVATLSLDRLIAELAARYDGLIPTTDLYDAGHCREAVANRVKVNSLGQVFPGVRRLGNIELTPTRRAMAAALVLPNSWVSHTSALAIHGATLRPTSIQAEISCPTQCRPRDVRAHRHPVLRSANRGFHHEIAVSRPWWAVIESASVLGDDDLAVAMDSLIQSKMASLKRLQSAHEEARWYRGRATVTQLLDDRVNGQGIVRSFLEQDLSRLLKRQKLRPPIRNFEVRLADGKKRVIDTAWPEVRVGLEAQSWKHHSNSTDWGRTMVRDRRLTAIGWTILPVVVADTRDPTSLLDDLRPLLLRVSQT
jgi:hypothetical protein